MLALDIVRILLNTRRIMYSRVKVVMHVVIIIALLKFFPLGLFYLYFYVNSFLTKKFPSLAHLRKQVYQQPISPVGSSNVPGTLSFYRFYDRAF